MDFNLIFLEDFRNRRLALLHIETSRYQIQHPPGEQQGRRDSSPGAFRLPVKTVSFQLKETYYY